MGFTPLEGLVPRQRERVEIHWRVCLSDENEGKPLE